MSGEIKENVCLLPVFKGNMDLKDFIVQFGQDVGNYQGRNGLNHFEYVLGSIVFHFMQNVKIPHLIGELLYAELGIEHQLSDDLVSSIGIHESLKQEGDKLSA